MLASGSRPQSGQTHRSHTWLGAVPPCESAEASRPYRWAGREATVFPVSLQEPVPVGGRGESLGTPTSWEGHQGALSMLGETEAHQRQIFTAP